MYHGNTVFFGYIFNANTMVVGACTLVKPCFDHIPALCERPLSGSERERIQCFHQRNNLKNVKS